MDMGLTESNQTAISDERCRALRTALNLWYARHRRDLPWRRSRDPYNIWLSEVMLQQTQVKTMIPFYHRFLESYPTVQALARADLQSVLKRWEGLGYYSRARHLHQAARIIAGPLEGQFPDSKQSWLQLPGVGDYIASAVASIVNGHPSAVVDGNVKRVMARLFCIDQPINRPSGHRLVQTLARQLLDTGNPGDFNQAVMELGALICKPRHPECTRCPVALHCCAKKHDQIETFPKSVKRAKLPERHLAVGMVQKKGLLLMVKRPEAGLLAGLWELPGGPVEKEMAPAQACVRNILETTNIQATVQHHIATVRHTYTHFKLRMDVFDCVWASGRIYLRGPAAFKWATHDHIKRLPLHGAIHKAFDARMRQSLSQPK